MRLAEGVDRNYWIVTVASKIPNVSSWVLKTAAEYIPYLFTRTLLVTLSSIVNSMIADYHPSMCAFATWIWTEEGARRRTRKHDYIESTMESIELSFADMHDCDIGLEEGCCWAVVDNDTPPWTHRGDDGKTWIYWKPVLRRKQQDTIHIEYGLTLRYHYSDKSFCNTDTWIYIQDIYAVLEEGYHSDDCSPIKTFVRR